MKTTTCPTQLGEDDTKYEVLEQIIEFENMETLTKGEEIRYSNLYVYHLEQFYQEILKDTKNLGMKCDLEKSKLLELSKFKNELVHKSSIDIIVKEIYNCKNKVELYNKRIDDILTMILTED